MLAQRPELCGFQEGQEEELGTIVFAVTGSSWLPLRVVPQL